MKSEHADLAGALRHSWNRFLDVYFCAALWLGDVVDTVVRARVEGDRIALLRNYRHAPEMLTEDCRELDVSFSTHGHRPALARLS